MNQGTYPLAASMINQINRLDQVSNNLANVNTNGFKQEATTETTFNYYLQRAQANNEAPTKINVVTNNIPKMDAKFINSEMGPITMTGNTLDFAMSAPDTFFKIQNADGDIVYTRDGAFKNLDNFLVDSNGNNVLNIDNEPIELEGEFASQIGVTKTAYSNLEKKGDNTYILKDANQVEIFENNDGMIVNGAIEKSNVNSVTAMVELIDAQRRFEQSQKAVKTIDELNNSINNNSLQMTATNSRHMTNINSSQANSNPKLTEVRNLEEQNDGNNVNLDTQMGEMSKNKILFDAIQSSIKRDSRLFRSVVESSAKN